MDRRACSKRRAIRTLLWRLLLLVMLPLVSPETVSAVALPDGFVINGAAGVGIAGVGIKAIAIQPWDAKIVIGGNFTITSGAVTWTNLARINHDGTLDTSFTPPAPQNGGEVRSLVVQPSGADGFILAGGTFTDIGGSDRKGLARFKCADGSLDVFDPVSTGGAVRINAMVMQPDGKSLLVGGSFDEIVLGQGSRNLARITLAAPDPGAATWSYAGVIEGEVNAVALQEGNILVAGSFQAPRSLLVRLNSSGTLDASFSGGFFTATPGAIRSLALQQDGMILVGGDYEASWSGTDKQTYLARLNRNGSHDTGFDPKPDNYVSSIVVRPDGKLMIAGDFTTIGAPAVPAQRLARLLIDNGNLDTSFSASLEAAVHVIVRQGDGKLLAGGEFSTANGKSRTRLARFYPQGAVDDDVSAAALALNSDVNVMSFHPDGTASIAGHFTQAQGKARTQFARLKENWDVAEDAAFDPNLTFNITENVMAALPDKSLIVAGTFNRVNGILQDLAVRIDQAGSTVTFADYNQKLKDLLEVGAQRAAQAVALLQPKTLMNGVELEDGMVYLGGNFTSAATSYKYLVRLKNDGTRDISFNPAADVNSTVSAIVIQPEDNKILVATTLGKILRLEVDGTRDASFPVINLGNAVTSLALQPDGRIIASGYFVRPPAAGYNWRNVVRIDASGNIEPGFNVDAWFDGGATTSVMRVVLQTDGSMLIYGVFNRVKDAAGQEYIRDNVARLKPNGELDQSFDLGAFDYGGGSPVGNISTVSLQSDGKAVLGGTFNSFAAGTTSKLARVSNGWASEDLSVSQDGTTITWLRSGTGPELATVTFEHATNPDAAVWDHVGNAKSVAGVWRLDKDLRTSFPGNGYHYLRARGYTTGEKGSTGSLVQSVRVYSLPSKTDITVTAAAKEKFYGDPDPALTFTAVPPLSDGDTFSGGLTRTAGENAGTYSIGQGTLTADAAKYNIIFNSATLTVKPKQVTATADDKEKTFGDADPLFSFTTTPALVSGDSYSGAITRVMGEDAGEYAITQGTLALSGNYALTFVAAKLKINPKQITVIADAKEKTYGNADPAFSYSFSPALVGGDSLNGALSRVAGENAGEYAIIQGTLAATGNYALTYVGANLKINPKQVTVTADAKEKTYGDADPAFSYSLSAPLVGADSLSGSLQRVAGENVGNYAITQGTLALSGNYTLTFIGANFRINPKQVTVTADAKEKTYGDADPAFTYSLSAPLIGADSLSGSLLRVAGENAGEYSITQGTLAASGNYALTYVGANLKINPKQITVTADAKEKTYGDADPAFTYSLSAPLIGADSFSGSLQRVAGENVGNYAIMQGTLALSGNYLLTFAGANFRINPKQVTVTADAKEKTYGDANPVLTYSFIPALVGTDSFGGSLQRVAGENVGNYAITQGSLALSGNYLLTFVGANFRINPRQVTVTADAKEKTYGDADPVLTYSFIPALVGTDSFSGGLQRAVGENVGNYAITQGSLALSGNYLLTFAGANFRINPKQITVTADAKEKTYGDADPACTYSLSAPLIGADSFSGSLQRVAGENVGNYAITQGTLALSGNYLLSFAGANFRINPRQVTVTADAKEKTYGDADPALTYSFTPALVGTDSFSGSLQRGAGENVGNYAITQGSLALSGNYLLSFVEANFRINPRQVTVTADAKEKTYGDADPALTYSFTPALVGTDSFSGSLQRVAGESVASGPHPINLGTLALSSNYSLVFQGALFRINRRDATIAAVGAGKTYGEPDPPLASLQSGLLPGDLGPGKIALGAVRDPGENVGSYPVRPTIGDSGTGILDNYTLQLQNGAFAIGKASLVITADNKARLVASTNPQLTATFAGFAAGDTPACLGGVPLLATDANAGSPTGSYPIRVSIGSITNNNYDYSFVDGALTVTGNLSQSITFNQPRPKTFGDGDFDPGAIASSGLTVSYATADPAIASLAGGRIRVVAPGSTTITASQPGNQQYAAAGDVSRILIVNPPPWNGLGFDGMDDLMLVEDAPQFNFGSKSGFSIEAWLHLDGSQPDGTGLVSKGAATSGWSGYRLVLHQDRIAAEIGAEGASVGIAEGLVGTTTLNDGSWHHVVLTVDRAAAVAALYLDGRVEAQVANAVLAGSFDNAEPLRVGSDAGGSRFFKGEMDEIRLWESARSQDQIRGSVSQILDPADEQQLVAYFHLDEGDVGLDNALFAKAPERTAHAADGALQGFALNGPASNWIRSGAFLPLLETSPVTAISPASAMAGGVVYPNYYPPTDVGLCWSTAPRPTLSDSCSRSGSGVGPFVGAITALAPGATYHVRAFAVNAMGTAYGNEISFQAARLDQTIEGSIADKTYGDAAFYPVGSSSSGLPVTYASADPEVALVVNGEIWITGAGSTVITASQGGNQSYNPAADVSIPFTVAKAPLRILAENKSRAYLTPNPELTFVFQGFVNGEQASVLSGAPLLSTQASLASPVGSYGIVADIGSLAARNYSFFPVNGTLSILKSCQEINFPAIPERTFGDPPFEIIASACSGLPLSFTSSNPEVAQVNGNVVTITGAGSAVITATQPGSDNLEGASERSQTLIVHRSGQGITFSSLAQKVLGDPPFTLSATASSGLPVGYLSSDTSVAVVSGNTVTIVGAGTTVISALQAGDGNYDAAIPAAQPLTVAREGTPPLLSLSTLSFGAVTANPVLNITGEASDVSGIATLTVNGVDVTEELPLFSTAVALASGANYVMVSATDRAGNRSTLTLPVTLDPLGPAIAVEAPADNSVTGQSLCTAAGSVTQGSTVTMWVNGGAAQLLPVDGGRFSGAAYLQEGVNTIELGAELYGRSTRAKRSVLFRPAGPSVAIGDPPEDLRTELPSLTIRGSSDIGPGGSLVLEVDGAVSTPEVVGGFFQQQVTLSRTGQIRITARAADGAGNSANAGRNVIRVGKVLGDLGGDGMVDIEDASMLLRISLGLEPVSEQALAHGDLAPLVNGVPQPDGRIDVGDLLVLLRKIVGLVDF